MDDVISRQRAIDAMAELQGRASTKAELKGIHKAWKRIKKLPPVLPRTGKWERHYSRPNVLADLFWHCSECGYKDSENYAPVYHHFCTNCGADMRTAEQIVHDAIDNTPMAEDAYPGIKERLHKAVDDMREVTNGN